MSALDEIRRRIRPGSGGTGPVSQTLQTLKEQGRRRPPRKGVSSPKHEDLNIGQSWPVALTSGGDLPRRELDQELANDDEDRSFPAYDSDNAAVLNRLFRGFGRFYDI